MPDPNNKQFNGAPLAPGNPGNSGGKRGRSGRPPSVIREACARAFSSRVKFLKDVVDGKSGNVVMVGDAPLIVDGKTFVVPADISDRLKAMDLLGKYGALLKIETETRDATFEDLMREAAKEHPNE